MLGFCRGNTWCANLHFLVNLMRSRVINPQLDPTRGEVCDRCMRRRGGGCVSVTARGRVMASPLALCTGTMRQGAEIGGASLMSDPRDINRDAKSRRPALKEWPGGGIGASPAAW